jgi:hypothetical protein
MPMQITSLTLLFILGLMPALAIAQEAQPIVAEKKRVDLPIQKPKISTIFGTKINTEDQACVILSPGQCCSFDISPGNPATFKMNINKKSLVEVLHIVNLSPYQCAFRLNAEASVPVRLGSGLIEGKKLKNNTLDTFLGGNGNEVRLEAMQKQPCKLTVFKETMDRFALGWGTYCPDPQEEPSIGQ